MGATLIRLIRKRQDGDGEWSAKIDAMCDRYGIQGDDTLSKDEAICLIKDIMQFINHQVAQLKVSWRVQEMARGAISSAGNREIRSLGDSQLREEPTFSKDAIRQRLAEVLMGQESQRSFATTRNAADAPSVGDWRSLGSISRPISASTDLSMPFSSRTVSPKPISKNKPPRSGLVAAQDMNGAHDVRFVRPKKSNIVSPGDSGHVPAPRFGITPWKDIEADQPFQYPSLNEIDGAYDALEQSVPPKQQISPISAMTRGYKDPWEDVAPLNPFVEPHGVPGYVSQWANPVPSPVLAPRRSLSEDTSDTGMSRSVQRDISLFKGSTSLAGTWKSCCYRVGTPDATKPQFQGFRSAPFRFEQATTQSVREWLFELADRDGKRRFKASQLHASLESMEENIKTLPMDAPALLERIRRKNEENNRQFPEKLEEDITQAPLPALPKDGVLAILTYTLNLYEDEANEVPSQFQIYGEFNAICREYSHAAHRTEDMEREWELFYPLGYHLDRAIRQLPSVSMVLYRGGSYNINTQEYMVGAKGSWGGCISASSDRLQAATFVSKESQLRAAMGCYYMILSDCARPIYHYSEFPEEMEHLHPLDLELEVCNVLPASILQLLMLNVDIITMKRAGSDLPIELHLAGLSGLNFIYDEFLASYIPPLVKEHPKAREAVPITDALHAFLSGTRPVLTIAAGSGMGKTSTALWLSRKSQHMGFIWLFVSLPSVKNLFEKYGIVEHLTSVFGFGGRHIEELKQRPLVLILDSLDEVPRAKPTLSWYELNDFQEWKIRLIVTCRENKVNKYGKAMGTDPPRLYLQPLSDAQVREYVQRRICPPEVEQHAGSGRASGTLLPSTPILLGQVQEMMEFIKSIQSSAFRECFQVPFKLSMLVDLFTTDPESTLRLSSINELYEGWLQQTYKVKGGSFEDLGHAEVLAWNMYCDGVTHKKVGSRGKHHWFRRSPLRVHNYLPETQFSFLHKSLQEYFVARYLFGRIASGEAFKDLGNVRLGKDFIVLAFFAETYKLAHDTSQMKVRNFLLDVVLSSRDHPELGPKAANAISLLNASNVPFSGMDLRNINVPKANLQSARLDRCNLAGANLEGADVQGAVLDYADLSGANLMDVAASSLMQIFSGHDLAVTSVDVSSCSTMLASGSFDKTVRVWSLKTGEQIRLFRGHTSEVTAVAMSHDTTLVVSGSQDTTVRVWSVAAGDLVHTMQGHSNSITAISIARSTPMLVSASKDTTLCVWNSRTGELALRLEQHTNEVTGAAMTLDGRKIISCSKDRSIRIWDACTGQVLKNIRAPGGALIALAASCEGDVIVTVSQPAGHSVINIWAAATGEVLQTVEGHCYGVIAVAVAGCGQQIVSTSWDHTVRVWSSTTGDLLRTLEGHQDAVSSVAVSRDGRMVVTGSEDKTVRVWNISAGEFLNRMEGHQDYVTDVAIASDGRTVVSSSDDATIRVWDCTTGTPTAQLKGHTDVVTGVQIANDGRIVSSSGDKTVRIWSAAGKLLRKLECHHDIWTAVACSEDCRLIASACEDKSISVWSSVTGEHLYDLTGHESPVADVAVSPDGQLIVSASGDKTVKVWDSTAGDLLHTLEGHEYGVTGVALSCDKRLVVSGSFDNTVRLWSGLTGQLLQTMHGHTRDVTAVAVSHDATFVVSSSGDCTVRMWSTETGECIKTFYGHQLAVTAVAISRDRRVIVSASADKTLRVWETSTGFLQHLWREVSERCLTLFASHARISSSTRMHHTTKCWLEQLGAVSGEQAYHKTI